MMTLLRTNWFSTSGIDIVGYLIFVIGVIALAYWTTRWLSRAYTKGNVNRNIKVLERVNLATDKSLWLIKVGTKTYFAYSDKQKFEIIDNIHNEDIVLPSHETESFESILKKVIGKKQP